MLTKLRLKNFKSFEHAEFDLGPVTTLIGTNASGKSNVRDALRILHGISRGYTLAESIGEKYAEHGFLQWKGIRGGTREMVFSEAIERWCEISITFVTELRRVTERRNSKKVSVEELKGCYTIGIGFDSNNVLKPRIRSESLVIDGRGEYLFHT
ncbi:MAG: AAA family ATPase, partial [Tumebacillaceae bacterium]